MFRRQSAPEENHVKYPSHGGHARRLNRVRFDDATMIREKAEMHALEYIERLSEPVEPQILIQSVTIFMNAVMDG